MPGMILSAAYFELAGTNLTANGSKIEVSIEVDEQEVTNFASGGWKELIGGLRSGEVAFTGLQEFGAGKIDELLWNNLGSVVTWKARASSAAVSATNPQYQGSCLVKEHKPISGSPGDKMEVDISLPTSGAVTRVTS